MTVTEHEKTDVHSAIQNGVKSGDTITIGGTQATVCPIGNGYGISLVAAGSDTSCEFANVVLQQQMRRARSSTQDLRDAL